jgi:RimJ/RimL family protein N-acetyltransferase
VDGHVRSIVESYWTSRLGVARSVLRSGGVHVVAADSDSNDAMSLLLDETCIVAVPFEEVEAARRTLIGLDAQAAFTTGALRTLVGTDALIQGPSCHNYVSERTFRGFVYDAALPVDGNDDSLLAFLESNDLADWAESGFPLEPSSAEAGTTRFWVLREREQIVAAGNMTEWRGLPADVGVLTHPAHRGRGFAGRLVGAMVSAMLLTVDVVRYRALTSNHASLAVAQRLGFEQFGQDYRARRHRDLSALS